jgi:hypothetical protein
MNLLQHSSGRAALFTLLYLSEGGPIAARAGYAASFFALSAVSLLSLPLLKWPGTAARQSAWESASTAAARTEEP